MPILALGVSYRRAPVEVLERLAFTGDDDPKAYRRLLEPDAVTEGVLLSTCNRVEVYAHVASYHSGFQELKRFLSESREITIEDFAEPLYSHYEVDATEHLFSVAAGIDSVVLGEPQILTQVRQAFARAQAERAVGPMLSALFRGAIRAGRRARAETSISSSPAAFVAAGLDLAERTMGPLRGRPAVVVGAGGMASLAAAELRERGLGPIRVVSRNLDRARSLAASLEAESDGLDRLAQAIAGADLVVSSTGAPQAVIGRRLVEVARRLRGDRPSGVFFLDLAVPRDVEPSVAALPGGGSAAPARPSSRGGRSRQGHRLRGGGPVRGLAPRGPPGSADPGPPRPRGPRARRRGGPLRASPVGLLGSGSRDRRGAGAGRGGEAPARPHRPAQGPVLG